MEEEKIVNTPTKEELKKDIQALPKSFNNPEKIQPKPEIQKPIVTETIGDRASFNADEKRTGILDPEIIIDKPNPRIERLHKAKEHAKTLQTLFGYAKPHWIFLVLSLLCSVINSICELLIPIITGKAIDCMISTGNVDFMTLKRYILYLVATAVGYAVFKWMLGIFENTLSYRTDKDIRKDLFKKFNNVPLKYIDGSSHGDLQSRMITDVENITNGFLEGITSGFDAIMEILLVIVYMFRANAVIAGVIVGLTPISLLVTGIIVYKSNKYFRRQAKSLGELSGNVVEMLGNQKVVIAFNYEEESVEQFEKFNNDLAEQNEKALYYSTMAGPTSRFINGVIYAIVAILGCIYALDGLLTIGAISILLAYANKYIRPFNEVGDIVSDLQQAHASARRVFNVISIDNEPSDENNTILTKCDGSVNIKDVYFGYSADKPLIKGLNVDVSAGQRVAIVGPTGCGKSTLINLLMRFYDVDKGDIQISGKSIYELTRASMRNKYGMVLQDTWLFSNTIRENISYGNPTANMNDVIAAAKMANVHEFIQTLPNGYETVITESGDNLSQGQKQLLCIARIMLTKPPMLILDEATSNIDTRTELAIQDAFNKMMEGRTSFVVAHRLSTIVNSDLILVMNKGDIIEQGTHQELLDKKGFYYALYNSQFSKV